MGLGMPRRKMSVGKDDVVTIHVVHPWQLWIRNTKRDVWVRGKK
jgi:hypothetical protein